MADDKLYWNAAAVVVPLGGGKLRLFQPVMRRNLIAPRRLICCRADAAKMILSPSWAMPVNQ